MERLAVIHVIEPNERGGESLYKVTLLLPRPLRRALASDERVPQQAAWWAVICRCRELITQEGEGRS